MTKIVSVGELLVDMIGEKDASLQKNPGFSKRAGGAPANVAVAASRMGAEVELVASVGQDEFGDFLIEKMVEENIGVENVSRLEEKTTLAFVSLDKQGRPHFIFYRGADEKIAWKQLENLDAEIVHVGSLPFTNSETAETLLEKVENTDTDVSFDPNLRGDLRDPVYEEKLQEFIEHVDVLTAAEDELEFFGGLEKLRKKIDEIIVTRGKDGAELYIGDEKYSAEAKEVEVIDTTGAGDALTGTYLAFRSEGRKKALERAVKAASLSTTSVGAMEALPRKEEL